MSEGLEKLVRSVMDMRRPIYVLGAREVAVRHFCLALGLAVRDWVYVCDRHQIRGAGNSWMIILPGYYQDSYRLEKVEVSREWSASAECYNNSTETVSVDVYHEVLDGGVKRNTLTPNTSKSDE